MNSKKLVVLALALAGAATAGMAQARGGADVQWSVSIGVPFYGLPLVVQAPPQYVQPYPVYREPVVVYPGRYHGQYGQYDQPRRWDRDGDGIPNRHDRVYNPRWDRDGDGIPNRYDPVYNPRWDRDGDGIPNSRDRHDDRRGHGRGL